jgi:pyruvate/2-oxoglutarate dehydrogenase complex dihydrolipoamide dehydrogenase (E3) component
MPVAKPVDLVVIGAGTAGIIAAKTAGGLGARVVLVERDRTGGDCLWTGCVPSKALIAAAASVRAMRSARRFVTNPVEPDVDFAAVMAHVHKAIKRIEPADSPQALTAAGAEVIHGEAVFTGPREVRVDQRRLRFRHALVATGSAPTLPTVPGLAEVEPITSDTVWELTELPRRLVVLGGGPIGCELGQAFARLGVEVTIVEAVERLVPQEEPQASAVLAARLASEGVRVLTATTVNSARGVPGAVELDTTGPEGHAVLCADRVLVATGRRPRTVGLGLQAAGVELDGRGYVAVDAKLRTSNPRVYAAGDVTGAPAFTHVAGIHGSIAATNAVLGPFRRVNHATMPWVTFTNPEIAHVGLTEAQARQRHGAAVRVRLLPHTHVDRAITEDDTDGFTHVVLGPGRRVLGATIVSPRGGEMLAELGSVVARGGRLREVSSVVHAYPTWADGVWNTALAEVRDAMAAPATRRATRLLMRLRRATSRT